MGIFNKHQIVLLVCFWVLITPGFSQKITQNTTQGISHDAPQGVGLVSEQATNPCEHSSWHGKSIVSITISGLQHTQPAVVSRELQHAVGGTFNCSVWGKEQKALQSLDIFAAIQLIPSPGVPAKFAAALPATGFKGHAQDSNTVALEYVFVEMFRYMALPALKSSDQDGVMLGLSAFTLNLLGRDIWLEVQARTSINPLLNSTEYMVKSSSPWLGSLPLQYELVFLRTDSYNQLKEFTEKSWWNQLHLQYPIWQLSNQQVLSAVVQNEWLYVLNGMHYRSGVGLNWDGRDRKTNTHDGVLLQAKLLKGGGLHMGTLSDEYSGAGGISNYWEYLLDSRGWFSKGKHIVHGASFVRYRPGLREFYLLTHAGGPNSVRGVQALAQNWGRHEALFTAEYRYEFFDLKPFTILGQKGIWGLQTVLGIDAGVLWGRKPLGEIAPAVFREARPNPVYLAGVYGGVHLLIPGLERLRFEYGMDGQFSAVFSFGMFEKAETQQWHGR
jgi:outer membrane protein assembly factor BamA